MVGSRFLAVAIAAVGATVGTAPVAAAQALGDPCSQWMQVGVDAQTGERMFCAAPPGSGTEAMTWIDWSRGAWGSAPMVGPVGSGCDGQPNFAFGIASDGYVVWCVQNQKTFLPGNATGYASIPTWSLYAP